MAVTHGLVDCQPWILGIPEEIWDHIFMSGVLDHVDLTNISGTCKYFQKICKSNELWRKKLQQRFPNLFDHFDRGANKCWQEVYKGRVQYGRRSRSIVSGLSSEYYNTQEISKEGFAQFLLLLEEHEEAGNYIMDELMNIVHDGKKSHNLTEKYYAEKVLRYLSQIHLAKKWQQYLQLPEAEQNLELGAVMIAQWCYPTISITQNSINVSHCLSFRCCAVMIAQWCYPTISITQNSINDQLDEIAGMVRRELSRRAPDHPACNMEDNALGVSKHLFKHSSSVSISEHLWSPQQCRVIMETLNYILFDKLGFCGNEENYYDPKNSYINRVLERKKGIPITLSIVYRAVARRLGVVCEAINFPSHFLLRWLVRPIAPVSQQYVFVDVFRAGRFMQQDECCSAVGIPEGLAFQKEHYMSVPPKKVLERMARNLVGIGRHQSQLGDGLLCLRNALDLFLIISPDDLEMRLLQVRINLHLNINLPDVIDSLQHVADLDPTRMGLVAYLLQEAQVHIQENKDTEKKEKPKRKLRKDNKKVEFSVGMVMKHKRYDYTCVIFGWDETCQATEEWIVQMGVHNLTKQHKQPFYSVLVEDGSNRYAAQENMLYTDSPHEIQHPEVGRYFQAFTGTYYIPNQEKHSEYQDDADVTRALLQKYNSHKNV
ncbi:F-box only protein 21-like [Haliotis rubra]|uniref:F-box only protein 21-like n=1 Tax=Haliotis rubra TaxID=36100 RepID=UPI001EE500E5|nr:F-box only protein 21-like [Haliotis rubra]